MLKKINTIVCFMLFLTIVSCQNPYGDPLKLGETREVELIPASKYSLIADNTSFSHVMIIFQNGGKALSLKNKDWIIKFYKGSQIVATLTDEQLGSIKEDSKCPESVIKHAQQNHVDGDAIFCNKFLDVESLDRITLERPNEELKECTKAVLNEVIEDIQLPIYSVIFM